MTNKEIARILQETASLIELTGGNPFRARAFSGAARTLERLDDSVEDLLRAGTLTDVHGIGAGLAAQVQELLASGSFALRDELFGQLPTGLLDVLRVKGLGAKKVRRLWQELGVTSLDALEAAAATGRLAEVDGFGEKTQENVLTHVRLLKQYRKRRRYADALALVVPALERLRQTPGVLRAELAGPLRRKLETVDEGVLVAAAHDPGSLQAALASWLSPQEADLTGSLAFAGDLPGGLPLRVCIVPAERFGTAWWHLTGSDAHCRRFADVYGEPVERDTEAALYGAAGLAVVPPELREGQDELEAAAEGRLPPLIAVDDLQGSLHNHSTYSDGAHTLDAMAEAAYARGLSYFGICDHSRSLAIANGLSIERVRAQQAEIRRLNEAFARRGGTPFRIFSGTESDILENGALDFPDEILASFDFVVASVHLGFNMTEEEATQRIIRAVENPYTTILGHATGRLLLVREGYPIDHERVIAACAANGVAIELNANPYRLDMDWRWLRKAADQGVLISINPDAHATEQLDYVTYGVAVARKAWLTRERCLNALPLTDFSAWLSARRKARS